MKKKISKLAIYWLSLFVARPFYWLIFARKNVCSKFLAIKISKMVGELFGQEAIIWRKEYDPIEKKAVVKVILALPSFGCSHYFKRGGCAMCGFNKEIERYYFSWLHPWALILLVKVFIINLEQANSKQDQAFTLTIFMAGSFFCSQELPLLAQEIVIDYFLASNFKKLLLESRPEYIIGEKKHIYQISKIIRARAKKLEVAIGLESVDDIIRNKYIGKHLSRQTYCKAVQILKKGQIIVNTYVLIGSPFVSEQEIITAAVLSANFAWNSGSDVVSFETYCVQAGTKWAKLYQQKKLTLPSLWAVLEVIRQANQICDNWILGEFSDWPQPIAQPTGCSRCSCYLLKILAELRLKHNFNILAKNFYRCACNKVFKFTA